MQEEKWTENMKEWMDIDEVLLDERLYEDRGYLYFGTSRLKSDCFSITVPGTGPLHITKENGIKLADAIYKSEGIDLRSEVTRLTAERDRMRKAMFGLKEYINTVRNSYLAERKSAPKDDIDGSQVASVYYMDGDLDRIITYCEKYFEIVPLTPPTASEDR